MMLLIAVIYSGFALIYCLVTKCPKNFLELTLNAHFAMFSLSLCLFSIVNTSVKSLMWSDSLLLLTLISSMYASMVLLKTGSNIWVMIL